MAFRFAAGGDDPRAGLWQFEGAILWTKAKAVQFRCRQPDRTVWLPRSKIVVDPTRSGAAVSLPEWLARAKGLL